MAEPKLPSPRARTALASTSVISRGQVRHPHTSPAVARGAWLIFLLLLGVGLTGCGNTIYAFKANSAANKVEEAHELGAEKLAPYEYFYAEQHLQKAQEEAAEADYSDAIDLADESEEYAEKAIRLTRDAQRGAGR